MEREKIREKDFYILKINKILRHLEIGKIIDVLDYLQKIQDGY